MAHAILANNVTESDVFHPEADFAVRVVGTISGGNQVYVQIANKQPGNQPNTWVVSNDWVNSHSDSFDADNRVKVFEASRGYAYRVQVANAGPTADWAHLTDAAKGNLTGS